MPYRLNALAGSGVGHPKSLPMKLLHPLIALSFLAPLPAADLIRTGKPLAEIVISESPARMTKLASRELQNYLERISGAKLEVVHQPSPGKMHVFVGKSTHTRALQLSTPKFAKLWGK